jgi:MYXO-CTERM domain-containing protein
MSKHRCVSTGSLVVGALAAIAAAQPVPAGMPRYTAIDLGMSEGTASAFIVSVGINNRNQVLGQVFGSAGSEAVIRTEAGNNFRYHSPDPINRSITPTAIDDAGNVTGYYTPSLVNQPFYIPAGTPSLTTFNDIPGPFPGTSGNAQRYDYANAISNEGRHIVGTGGNTNSNLMGWISSNGGPVTTLPSDGYRNVTPTGVSSSGAIVGQGHDGMWRALRWENASSQPIALADLGGGLAQARALNDRGYTVGQSYIPNASSINHAVIWDAAGNATDIHTASGFTFGTSVAIDINSSNWTIATGGQRFLYIPGIGGATMTNLITSYGTMASLGGITGINDMGYISAHGVDSVGRSHLYLLVPDHPAPSPGALSVLGIAGLVAARRRRA